LVRPFTVGTEIGGAFKAESLPARDAVLDAVFMATGAAAMPFVPAVVLELAAAEVPPATLWVGGVEELADRLSFGDGVASLLAAQPIEPTSASRAIVEKREDLSDTNSGIS
jgi:hypothetical protein